MNTNQRPQATPTRQIDNERVIVTQWHFEPGAETGWHTHGFDYVVVPTTDGDLLLETPDGPVQAKLTRGVAYNRPAGVHHNVVNAGNKPLVFVEIELR
ncbi:MAG: cupin domain-containing protein [Burkholderiaceae bacterium]|nr:cupin domain-containing protein [Burkholderiaceae bacterium]MCD8517587.1 cupin domain-containing protein [Burkholderiaceae bacterium]MCD8537380.1 cupin domain-containing protein [Burkholderiaceae bacterium]